MLEKIYNIDSGRVYEGRPQQCKCTEKKDYRGIVDDEESNCGKAAKAKKAGGI